MEKNFRRCVFCPLPLAPLTVVVFLPEDEDVGTAVDDESVVDAVVAADAGAIFDWCRRCC